NLQIDGGGILREFGDNQIADTATVTVSAGGTFDLFGHNDSIGPLTLAGGSVSTGAGTLVLQGDVTTNAATAPATISGNLDLGGTTRAFTVANGTADPDLEISAVMSNGGLFKFGNG